MAYSYGIDVSKYQGTIDWAKVKAAGKKFAILKATMKDNSTESSFERNYKGASGAGLQVGVYRYVYALNTADAVKEANAIVNLLKGRSLTAGIWLDMEDKSIKVLSKKALTDIINAEANIFKKAGYSVGIYCNRDWYLNVLDSQTLSANYPFWIARYPSTDTGVVKETLNPKSLNNVVAWQYSSKGTVPGIVGNVDLDLSYSDLASVMCKQNMTSNIYYPKYTGTSTSITTALAAVGEKDTSLTHRKKIAAANGIPGAGTAEGNTAMLNKLKAGLLIIA